MEEAKIQEDFLLDINGRKTSWEIVRRDGRGNPHQTEDIEFEEVKPLELPEKAGQKEEVSK
jgi:hypothetical protein